MAKSRLTFTNPVIRISNNKFCNTSGNVLLDKDRKAKISDFGLARSIQVIERESVSATALNACGTHGYMPPEAKYGVISRKYDVYGFGVVRITVPTLIDLRYKSSIWLIY